MATLKREHYIPLRQTDLVHLLANEPSLDPDRAGAFRRFCDILSATLHFEYKRLFDSLKDTYAPFDPEATTVAVKELPLEERQAVLDELFRDVDELLRKANFIPLDKTALAKAAQLRSEWGINMTVDFNIFEKIQVYIRGDATGKRSRRTWRKFWKEEAIEIPVYQRLALIIKLKKSKHLPSSIDTDDVFLKYFKDIPQADIEMLLPGTRIVMPGGHRLKIGSSIVSGLAILVYNSVKVAVLGFAYLAGIVFALLGYGWRQYAGYQNAKHACNLRLTQSLYYQTLANNVGVLHYLLDEAEEQDAREAILAYFFLWHVAGPAGMTAAELDAAIERDLEVKTGQPVDFEVDDALAKLERMKVIAVQGNRYVAVPIETALQQLDRVWDNQFTYHNAEAA
jgi:hypothetical protein